MAKTADGRPTIHDVADEAGVSYQTVSRVINNSPKVASKTRARVLDAIRKLDYRPIQAARNLSSRRSYTIQILAFNWNHYSLQSMVSTANAAGFQTGVIYLKRHDLDEFRSTVAHMVSHLIDGAVIVAMPFEMDYDQLLKLSRGIPFVQIGGVQNRGVPYVGHEQTYASRVATEHLIQLGHRRIAEISGSAIYPAGPLRHQAFLDTLIAAGLEPGRCIESDWNPQGGYTATRELLAAGPPDFTALICGNDLIALGAARAIYEHGLRIPEDISLVGFDDIEEAAYFNPPLTTVRQDFDALGTLSVEYLLSLIDQPDTPIQQRMIYPKLIARQSTRRLAPDDA